MPLLADISNYALKAAMRWKCAGRLSAGQLLRLGWACAMIGLGFHGDIAA